MSKSSGSYKLSIFLDQESVIKTKMKASKDRKPDILFKSRSPVALDPNHIFTSLLIYQYYQEFNHIGLEILNIRAAVEEILNGNAVIRTHESV